MTASTIIATASTLGLTLAAVSLDIPPETIWTIAGVLISALLGRDVWARLRRAVEVQNLVGESDQSPSIKSRTPEGKRDELVLKKLNQIHAQQLDLRAHVDARFDEAAKQREANRHRIDRLEALYTQGDSP